MRGWQRGPYGADGAGHGLVAEFSRRRVSGQAAGLGRGARGAGHSAANGLPEKGAPAVMAVG